MSNIYDAPLLLFTGWICPHCNRVKTPSLPFCSCEVAMAPVTTTGSYTDSSTAAVWDDLSDEALVRFEDGLDKDTAVGGGE